MKEPLNYSLRDIVLLEASSCKYLGIILRRDLSWADQTWKELHLEMRIIKNRNGNPEIEEFASVL
jgi:DUF2075 family protein